MNQFQKNSLRVKRVTYAINHYISTADYLGQAQAIRHGNELIFFVLVNPRNPLDCEDWQKFLARLHELSYPKFQLKQSSSVTGFLCFDLKIATKDCIAFAHALCQKPGPLGWGSVKKYVDLYGLKPYGL